MMLPKIYGLSMALPQKILIFPQLPTAVWSAQLQHARGRIVWFDEAGSTALK